MTIKEALKWSDKHRRLRSDGARVAHIKQLLKITICPECGNPTEPKLHPYCERKRKYD